MLRNIIRSVVRFLFWVLSHLQVVGLENVPREGACILAANHMSRIDPALVFALVDRNDLTALVADKYLRYPLIRELLKAVNAIWINREQADFQALRAARDFLRKGGALGIAPEGTRSRQGALLPAKTGVAYLAEKSNVPIIPVAISGSEKAVRQLLQLRRPQLQIVFGEPFFLPPLERGDRSSSLQRNTDEIMCRIAVLLPPVYWGAYAGHPCLQGLLSGQSSGELAREKPASVAHF